MIPRRKPGFTLMELLVVIALMIILAGLLLPVIARGRESARRSRCIANLKQLSLAHRIYADDYDEVLPPWQMLGPRGPVLWPDLLRPYYRDPRLLDDGFGQRTRWKGTEWEADYALCTWGPGGEGTMISPYWRWPGAPSGVRGGARTMTEAEVLHPAQVLQITDGLTTRYPRSWGQSWIVSRHLDRWLTGAFADGHARVVSPADWMRVDYDRRGFYFPIASADRPLP
jgi:prepilin-type N-terminal cleavage/methylation domain-containing protein